MRALLLLGLMLWAGCPGLAPRAPLPPPDPGPRADSTLRVTFVDVGQGESILFQKGDVDLLIDTGPPGKWPGLQRALATVRGPLDGLIITHPHIDHDGQVAEVLGAVKVGRVWTNGDTRGPIDFNETGKFVMGGVHYLEHAGFQPEILHAGDVLQPLPGVTMTVLSSGEPGPGYPVIPDAPTTSGSEANNRSAVFLVEYEGRRLLLASDIEIETSLYLVGRFCENGDPADCPGLAVDVLQEPHHGSAKFAPEFFQAAHPRFAVLLADHRKADHCLPRVEVVQALRKLGTTVFSTSSEGVEDVTLDILAGGKLRWTLPRAPLFAWKRMGKICDPVTFER